MGSKFETRLLGELCHEITVGFVGSMTNEYIETGIPFLRSKNIDEYNVKWDDMKYISSEFHKKLSKSALKSGDVAIVRTGKPGTTCVIPDSLHEANCSDIVIARVNNELLCPHYLSYFMNAMAHGQINAHVVGAVQQHFNVSSAKKLEIPLPSRTIQIGIVQVLKVLDDKLKLNRQINQTLEHMAQALFKSWFVDFDPVVDNALDAGFFEQNSDLPEALLRRAEQRKAVRQRPDFKPLPAETRQLFPAAFKESEESSLGLGGWVPKGWELGHLSDIAGYGSKRVDVLNLTVDNYISTENMLPDRKGVQPASNLPTLNSVPAYTNRYVLVSNIRPYFKKIWLASGDGGYSNDVLGFESKNAGDEHFLFNLLYQDVFFDFMMATSKGSKMPRGDKKTILSWELVIPPLLLRKFFSTNVSHFYESMTHRNNECNTLSQLRDTLLPKLIAGELRLNDNALAADVDNND
ncbi:restriction endonuclease subunit S [Edwardsiella hoshinae]|uniref:Restriction endonuclease subunit S n=1 Tax=Edwardsiella hoshinae TaxID=93378 RepID=A0ABM6EIM8_9GAMM|nr:restriction endonuclease subunit S [Edwardsiella hoshinae]AOV96729.1 restriction endonuclease subunit S [Edwardsiella hoshinae]